MSQFEDFLSIREEFCNLTVIFCELLWTAKSGIKKRLCLSIWEFFFVGTLVCFPTALGITGNVSLYKNRRAIVGMSPSGHLFLLQGEEGSTFWGVRNHSYLCWGWGLLNQERSPIIEIKRQQLHLWVFDNSIAFWDNRYNLLLRPLHHDILHMKKAFKSYCELWIGDWKDLVKKDSLKWKIKTMVTVARHEIKIFFILSFFSMLTLKRACYFYRLLPPRYYTAHNNFTLNLSKRSKFRF